MIGRNGGTPPQNHLRFRAHSVILALVQEFCNEQNSSARSHIPLRAERVKHKSHLDFNPRLTTILPRNIAYLPPSSAERLGLDSSHRHCTRGPTSEKRNSVLPRCPNPTPCLSKKLRPHSIESIDAGYFGYDGACEKIYSHRLERKAFDPERVRMRK